ncbi:MAG: 4-alpha-glucanotransferase [Planctomycetota bacterium]|jgi:4-alpha-glucanotransferase
MKKRSSGIICHITSLPSRYGVGDIGPASYKFADFLAAAGQRYWQVLPLNPPAIEIPHSPYNCISAYAGNGLLISPELLHSRGLLTLKEIRSVPVFPPAKVNYRVAIPHKTRLLKTAYARFKLRPPDADYNRFCQNNAGWLDDFAAYAVLRRHLGAGNWYDWPAQFRDKEKFSISSLNAKMRDETDFQKFIQYEFFRQWSALKRYCKERGVAIIGDVPIYVSFDSADVWANPHLFKLNKRKKPEFVSGVPPDYFNKKGQRWGNPIYDWQSLKKTGYSWWLQRMKHNLAMFDVVRIDHFRGFVAYWQIPAECKTAVRGKWVKVPKEDFFSKLLGRFPARAIIVEDLGHITPAVRTFVDNLALPGMRVLLFGFDADSENIHAPANHVKNCVVYTGTHDTNTAKGWFVQEADPRQKKNLFDHLGQKIRYDELHWALIELAAGSVAKLTIIPMQDVLGLGAEARMNLPGTFDENNWAWRFSWHRITGRTTDRLKKITLAHGRA